MSTLTTQTAQPEPDDVKQQPRKNPRRDPKDPDVMIWLERERYVTMAYQFQEPPLPIRDPPTAPKRRLFQQDSDEFRDDVLLRPIVKVRFAGVIYRPLEGPPLPDSLKEFKRKYGTIRALHHESAKQRFAEHALVGEINLMPFLKKLLAYKAAEQAFNLSNDPVKRPMKLPRKPSLPEYLRANLRKLLVKGCYKPRNPETHLQRKKVRDELRKLKMDAQPETETQEDFYPEAPQDEWRQAGAW